MAEIFLDKAKISQRIYYLIFVQCVPLYNIPNIFFFIIFFFGKSSGQIDNFAQQKKNMPLPYYKCLVEFCHKSLIKTPPTLPLPLPLSKGGKTTTLFWKIKYKFSIGNRSIEQRLPPLDRY